MNDNKILPPPTKTLLIYAAYGWAAERRWFAPSGRPVLPEQKEWAPQFAALLEQPGGWEELRTYAESGMIAWGVHPSIIAVVKPAFASPELAKGFTKLLTLGQQGTATRLQPTQTHPSAPPIPATSQTSEAGNAKTIGEKPLDLRKITSPKP